MIQLTKAEEQVMQVLWNLEKAFVKEIIAELPEPKPAYNTVSTIIRILEKKEVVDHEAFGKSYRYFPLITKEAYSKFSLTNVVENYFEGSAANVMSFFVKNEKVDTQDLDEMMKMIEELRNKKS